MSNEVFPDCMMPDGAEPCRGYQQLQTKYDEARAEIARLRAPPGASAMEKIEAHYRKWKLPNVGTIDLARLIEAAEARGRDELAIVPIPEEEHPGGARRCADCGACFDPDTDWQRSFRMHWLMNHAPFIKAAQREATEKERQRCATIDNIDLPMIRREARAQMREEALAILHEEGWLGRSEQRIAALPDEPPKPHVTL